jgi:chemotaxis signal transduction protein
MSNTFQRIEDILAERADRLAHRHKQVAPRTRHRDVLILKVGNHLAGIDVAFVQEIIKVENFVPVPDASESLLGILNIHNNFVSLLDPRSHLEITRAAEPYPWALILRHESLHVALACDEVLRIEPLPVDAFDEQGAFRYHDAIGSMLDVTRLLLPLEQPVSSSSYPSLNS